MTETCLWTALLLCLPAPMHMRSSEVVSLDAGLPTVGELFDFMRDAELRFGTPRPGDRGACLDSRAARRPR